MLLTWGTKGVAIPFPPFKSLPGEDAPCPVQNGFRTTQDIGQRRFWVREKEAGAADSCSLSTVQSLYYRLHSREAAQPVLHIALLGGCCLLKEAAACQGKKLGMRPKLRCAVRAPKVKSARTHSTELRGT